MYVDDIIYITTCADLISRLRIFMKVKFDMTLICFIMSLDFRLFKMIMSYLISQEKVCFGFIQEI